MEFPFGIAGCNLENIDLGLLEVKVHDMWLLRTRVSKRTEERRDPPRKGKLSLFLRLFWFYS